MCLITNEPDYQLIYLDLSRLRIVGVLNLNRPVSRIAIHPQESHYVLVCGENFLKSYKIREQSVYVQPDVNKLNQNQNFTDVAWFDENQYAVTNQLGEVFIGTLLRAPN